MAFDNRTNLPNPEPMTKRSQAIIGRTITPKELLRSIPEADIQAQIIELAGFNRWLVYHTHDSRRSQEGFPDLVLARAPRLILAEVKREGARLDPAQEKWAVVLAACPGIEYYVWRLLDWAQIEEILK